MGDLQIGYTWPSGATATATKLNDSVNEAVIVPGALSADAAGRAKMADMFTMLIDPVYVCSFFHREYFTKVDF